MLFPQTGRVHPAFLLIPGERLSQAELSAARLDGDVVELGDAYTPTDLVESAVTRAHGISMHRHGHAGLAFVGPSAAWILGAGDQPPNHHHLQRAIPRRGRLTPTPRATLHDTLLPEGDQLLIGDVLVSTPGRTLWDLARWARRDTVCVIWARRLARLRPDSLDDALARLPRLKGQPGYRMAMDLLAQLSEERASPSVSPLRRT